MNGLRKLELAPSSDWENSLIESIIAKQQGLDGVVQILEAGCGQKWGLRLDGILYRLTGVDIDAAALEARRSRSNDLDEIVVGDLRDVSFPNQTFDVIYNSFVLEHVAGAEQVLASFERWLRPDGVLVLRIPDPRSAQGFATKVTPHWFHVLYKRFVEGKTFSPCPTYYDPVVSREGIHAFSAAHGLSVVCEYGDGYFRPGKGMMQLCVIAVKRVMHALSFGALAHSHTNLLYILRKGADPREKDIEQVSAAAN